MRDLFLVFVERRTEEPNPRGFYEYDFYFSETPDITWGTDWAEQCPSACSIETLRPDEETYHEIKKLISTIPLSCVQENSCFSLQDMTDGIVSVCYENISGYEEFPEPIRLVFQFSEPIKSVEDKLARRHQFFGDEENSKEEDGEEKETEE